MDNTGDFYSLNVGSIPARRTKQRSNMSKVTNVKSGINKVQKRTSQGGKVKTSTLNKTQKHSFKRYNGQGR